MHSTIGKRSAIAGLAALAFAMTATVAIAGGHGSSGGYGSAASGHDGQLRTREQTRMEIAEHVRQGQPAAAGLMSLEQIETRLRAEGYGDISEIERKHMRFQVTARNQAGMPAELLVDATSGAILRVELED